MTMVKLGDLVTVSGGGTPKRSEASYYGGTIPWVTPKDMKLSLISDSLVRLTPAGVQHSPAKIIPPGSVLVVVRSGVLKHTLPVALTQAPVTVNQDMKALTPGDRVLPEYLARLIKSLEPRALKWVRATTADNFPIQNLLDVLVDLPPLIEQRRIAAILDQADSLGAKRRQVVNLLDDLAQSVFVDMFGDPDETIRAGRTVPLSDVVADLQGGRNLVAPDSQMRTRNRVLKISAVTTGRFRPTESKPLPDDYEPPANHFVRQGDLLMSRANTTELVGAAAIVRATPGNLVLPDKIWRFVWREPSQVEPLFVWSLLRTSAMRRQLSARSSGTGGSMKNISKTKLSTLPLVWPDHAHQVEFATRLKAAEDIEHRVVHAPFDELQASLRHRAFTGGL